MLLYFNKLITAYIVSMSVWTLYNQNGITPISLFIALAIFFVLMVNWNVTVIKSLSVLDFLLILFLFYSTVSVTLNIQKSDLNMNHLYAEFVVIFLFYFVFKCSLYNIRFRFDYDLLIRSVYYSAIIVSISGIVDYALLTQGVNIVNYLPMEQANKVAGVGVYSRARGFFVEPTDFALALNVLFPLLVLHEINNNKYSRVFLLLVLYFFCMAVARSAAAAGGIVLGVFFAFFSALVLGAISKRKAVQFLVPFAVFMGLIVLVSVSYFSVFLENIWDVIYAKVTFSENSMSAMGRLGQYAEMYRLMFSQECIMIGCGTGFLSGHYGESSLSWFLSVLVEKGLVGGLILMLIIAHTIYRLIMLRGVIGYGLLVSFVSTVTHYATQTGFYFPFFWFILALSQYNTRDFSGRYNTSWIHIINAKISKGRSPS